MLCYKQCTGEIKSIDAEKKRVTALASTPAVDRGGDIVLSDAWDLGNFRANPVFLWAHKQTSDDPSNVLGRVETVTDSAAGLVAEFAYDTEINPKAKMVFDQVQAGSVRGFSVGFLPKDWVTPYSPQERIDALPEFARQALKSGGAWVVYTKAELLEISQVPIPMHQDALAMRAANQAVIKHLEDRMNNAPTPTPQPAVPEPAPVEIKTDDLMQRLNDNLAANTEAIKTLADAIQKMAAPGAPAPIPVEPEVSVEITKEQWQEAFEKMTAEELQQFIEVCNN